MTTIRRATVDDIDGLAYVHVESWKTTYAGILPEKVIAARTVERRHQQWEQDIERGISSNFVAVNEAGQIIGFVGGGPTRTPELGYDAELYAIYLLEEAQGQGLGRKLMDALNEALLEQGFTGLHLWVLKDNPAEHFYSEMGGVPIKEQSFDMDGNEIVEICYAWSDINLP